MKKLIWFLIPLLSYGQCDIEIYGFNPISTDMTLVVNGGYCGTPSDSIGEFLLGISFTLDIDGNFPDVSQFDCFYDDNWALLIFPLNFPGFDIGEGSDQIIQTGDTLNFTLNEIPSFGSGTADCWIDIMQSGAYFQECVIINVWQINDSDDIFGGQGLGGFPYPDENPLNNWVNWSLNGACDPPPPPIVYGCTDMFAYNYNSAATMDDESCIYQGCMDELALNYCPECTVSGDCIYEPDDGGSGDDCNDPAIHTPNTFTPNNDGLNDYWRPVTMYDCWWEWEVRVYNRWGTLVWVSYDPRDKWLGNRLGYFVPDGVYTYTIKGATWESQKVVSMAGHITIFR
jgi:gliding motility-associated-like protein